MDRTSVLSALKEGGALALKANQIELNQKDHRATTGSPWSDWGAVEPPKEAEGLRPDLKERDHEVAPGSSGLAGPERPLAPHLTRFCVLPRPTSSVAGPSGS